MAYHQDNAYLQWFTPPEVLSCWVALDQTSADGGTLEFVRGSHRWAHCKPAEEFHGPSDYQKQMRTAARRQGSEPDIVKVIVPEGGGSFHHGWTWHGSGYNRTDKQRRSLVLHAMRCDAKFEPRRFASGIGPIYSRYRRLGDQEMDENHFPDRMAQ